MKNQRTLLLYMLTLLLSAIAVPADAQQRQDALYIFRNDGQFNAFFYGDIQRICYSNIDTLGVAHDDFVVQEVWALDTVYRIPVSAIDSVSFVTPETIIKKDVFCPDASIVNYIVASDSVSWIRLAKNTPKGLIPKVGDKLYIQESSDLIPDRFVGLVTSVTEASDGITVMTGDVEITDIFDRLVAKAAAATPELVSSARAAIFDGTEITFTPEEPIDLPVFTGTFPLQGSYALGNLGPVEFSGDATGSVSASAKLSLRVRLFLYVDALSGMIQSDETVNYTYEVTKSATIAGSITGHVDVPFKGISKKLSDFFKLNLSVGWFFDAQFTGLDLSYSYKSTDTGVFKQTVSGNFFNDEEITPIWRTEGVVTGNDPEWKLNSSDSWALSTGIYAQASFGAGIPFWKEPSKDSSAEVKVRLEGGLKASFSMPKFDYKSLGYELYKLINSQTVYTLLDKESDIGWSLYGKLSLSYQFGKWTNSFNPELSLAKNHTYGAVPKITNIGVSQDNKVKYPKAWRYRLTAPISRDLFPGMGANVGFLVTNADGTKAIARKCSLPWFGDRSFDSGLDQYNDDSGTYSEIFDDIDPGKGGMATYVAYPMVTLPLSGLPVLVDKKKTFKVPEAHFEIENRNVVAIEEELADRSLELSVIPNMKNVEVTTKSKWLTQNFYGHDYTDDYLALSWEPLPDSTFQRKAVINLKGFSSHDPKEVLVEDSIIFIQSRPSLKLSADSLIFNLEGGTKTVEILNTNLENVRIPINYHETEKWLRCTLEDDVITVTVEKSEEPYRAVFVVVWGNTPNGALIERAFWVRQYSTEIVPTVDPDLLVFPLEGGEKTAVFNKADYPYSGVYVSEEGKKWARAKLDDNGVVTVTVDPTKDEQGRGCSVVCWADNSPTPSENAVLVPITVKQVKPEIKKIYFKTFNKVHSEIVRYHEDEPDNFWNWLLMDATAESHEMDLMVTKDNFTIKTSIDGNTMHVDCVGSAQKFGTTQKATLSFDVVNYNAAKPDKAMVTNVKMTNDVTMNAGGGSASMNMKVNVDNIPVWNLSPLYIASAGTVANGVKFSNFYDVISVPDGKATGYYEEDNGNNALLRISFEGNDNDDWTDVVDLEDWGDDDDDDDDWGDWSRSTVKQAKQKRVHSALERRLLQQVKKIKKQ